VTRARAAAATQCAGETGAAVRRTRALSVVPDVDSVTTNVSAKTTDLSSADVSAPTTSVRRLSTSPLYNVVSDIAVFVLKRDAKLQPTSV